MVTQKNSIINSMYLYVAYNCIPLTCLVTVTKLRHSTGSLYMNGEQYEVEIANAMFLMSSFTSLSMELLTMFLILCSDLGSWHIKSVYKINRQSVNPSLVQTSIHAANHSF